MVELITENFDKYLNDEIIYELAKGFNDFHSKLGKKQKFDNGYSDLIKRTADPESKLDCQNLIIALHDGKVAGFILGETIQENRGKVIGLYVREQFQRQGIAEKLMKKQADYFKSKGIDKVVLSVYKNNDGAKVFYSAQGFVENVDLEKQQKSLDFFALAKQLPRKIREIAKRNKSVDMEKKL